MPRGGRPTSSRRTRTTLREVEAEPRSVSALDGIAIPQDLDDLRATLVTAARRLAGRTVWHVNSTSEGGGVAELLHQLLGYVIDGGVVCRWLVLEGDPRFFEVTKRVHNRLHASEGDGGPLGDDEHAAYADIMRRNRERHLGGARL